MMFTFCPNCGKPGTIEQKSLSTYICSNCAWTFWNNPKATVAAIFRQNGELLFAKRGIEPNKGMYDFPGGFVDYGEDVFQACVREIKEETTADIKAEDLHLWTAYTTEYLPDVSVVDLVFLVDKWVGDLVPQDDVAALEWKPATFLRDKQFSPVYNGLMEKLAAIE